MDRRGFLKLGALLPFYKKVIKELIEKKSPEPVEELFVAWKDLPGVAGPLPHSNEHGYDEQIFAPDPDRVGDFIAVGRLSPLLTSDCYPGLDIQIKTGHCDESENLLDL